MLYESDSDLSGLPDGVVFWGEQQSQRLDDIVNRLTALYRNYHRVIPPVFEYYETFEKGGGLSIARRSFSFKDKDGKLLSLRYDMTTPIARMMGMKFRNGPLPIRFYYAGDVFREQALHEGKLRQIRQVGIEHIGVKDGDADLEVVRLLGQSLSEIDRDYTIVIGNVEIYRSVLARLSIDDNDEAVHAAFHHKDTTSLDTVLGGRGVGTKWREILLGLTRLAGKPEVIGQRAASLLATAEGYFEKHVEPILALVDSLPKDIAGHVIIDLGLLKDFSYYSSLTLEGYVKKLGFPVANGGRYDGLYRQFGGNLPAVGFAIDIGYCVE
jgi:ATP phosphoribosyltransferase regulatory subunit